MRQLYCDTHGPTPWELTIMCMKCERVYQAVRAGEEFKPICDGAKAAPEHCECGARLPIGVAGGGTARAICTSCFKARVAS